MSFHIKRSGEKTALHAIALVMTSAIESFKENKNTLSQAILFTLIVGKLVRLKKEYDKIVGLNT